MMHPKDKKKILETSEVVYEVPCKGCNKSYVGETGRQLGVRLNEHQKDSEKIADKKFTRATRESSVTEQHKSAITDHVAQDNHLIDWAWEETKIIDRDSVPLLEKYGLHSLDHVYNPLLLYRLNILGMMLPLQ